jgi:membrane protease YdiL (CAAX protease family)
MRDSSRRAWLLATPPVLIVTTQGAFQIFTRTFGLESGYLGGFVFYWLFWCVGMPAVVLGREGISTAFRRPIRRLGHPPWFGALALGLPLVLGYGYAFPRAIVEATPVVILVSAAIAILNAPLEELLWRGTYVAVFRESRLFSSVYPTVGFALWHLAPLSVVPNRAPGGSASFVIVSGVVGFLWSWVAVHTRSVWWTSVAHALFDFSGLGGRIYFR